MDVFVEMFDMFVLFDSLKHSKSQTAAHPTRSFGGLGHVDRVPSILFVSRAAPNLDLYGASYSRFAATVGTGTCTGSTGTSTGSTAGRSVANKNAIKIVRDLLETCSEMIF